MADWTDVVGAVGGSVGTAIAAAVAGWTIHRTYKDRSEREAAAAENREQHRATAAIAQAAADSAAVSATEARRLADVHIAVRHQSLAPTQRTVPTYTVQTPTGVSLFGRLQVERDYRAQAFWVKGPAKQLLSLDLLITANAEHKFHLERWPADRTTPELEAVILRLWPPDRTDPVENWTCECGRPTVQGRDDEPAHWELRLPVVPPDPAPFFAAEWRGR